MGTLVAVFVLAAGISLVIGDTHWWTTPFLGAPVIAWLGLLGATMVSYRLGTLRRQLDERANVLAELEGFAEKQGKAYREYRESRAEMRRKLAQADVARAEREAVAERAADSQRLREGLLGFAVWLACFPLALALGAALVWGAQASGLDQTALAFLPLVITAGVLILGGGWLEKKLVRRYRARRMLAVRRERVSDETV